MLRLIIADDEKIIRDTISSFIDWSSIGIELVAVCKNGLEAYDAIIDEYPDIVLTDIKMPGFTGLELISRLTKTHKELQFIILSGYRDFNFTVEAMRYGIRHYLLKPCNEKQIIEAINEVKTVCYEQKSIKSKEKVLLNKKLILHIVTEGIQSHVDFDQISSIYKNYLASNSESYYLCYLYFLEEMNLMESAEKITVYMKKQMPETFFSILYVKNSLVLVMEDSGYDMERFDQFARQLTFSIQSVNIEYHRVVYHKLLDLLKVLTDKLKRFDMIYFIEDSLKTPICNCGSCLQMVHKLTEQLLTAKGVDRSMKIEELQTILSTIEDESFLRILITDLILAQNSNGKLNLTVKVSELLHEISTCENPKEHYLYFVEILFVKANVSDSYNPLIDKMFACVEEHISDSALSLKWIAEHELFMSVNYISKQFVKQTGIRFSQYLNEKRIELAKQYLIGCQEDMVYQVAEKIGCGNNPQYFSQLFKKYTGLSPSAYVKLHRNME